MTKQLLRPALFWLMTLTLLWSCQETLESPIDDSTDLSLAEAQSFYEQIQAQAKAVSQNSKANKRTQKTSRKAFWDKQEKYKAGSQELISIPVLFDDDLNTPGFGFKKMVFYKDTKTNKTNARIIEYIFDKTYLTKNFGNLSMKTFTGMMVVYDADGNYLDGVGVKDGKQTNKVAVGLDGEIMKAKNANGRESATTINCEATYTGYNCNFGGGALGTASNTGTGYTPNDLISKCTTVYVQSISNCDSGGGSGTSTAGYPYPLPGLVGPNPWDTFSGFAGGGGGGGYVYSGSNTNVGSLEQTFLSEISSIYPGISFSSEENSIMIANPWMIPIVIDYIRENLIKPDFSPNTILNWIKDVRIKSIYIALKSSSTILDDFAKGFSSDKLLHIVYKDASTLEIAKNGATSNTLAITIPFPADKDGKWFMVYLDREKLSSRKKIYTATAILHETLHAKFLREKYLISHDPSLPESQQRQMIVDKLLFDYDEKHPEKTGIAQHQKMAEEYIKPMADALWKYHNKKFPLNYYENLSWLGLQETSAWLSMNGLQRDAILRTMTIFDNENE
jgi:hypothetical protein